MAYIDAKYKNDFKKIRSKKIPSIIFYFPSGGNISIGAMYRILLDKGYDAVARDQLKLRQSVRV